MWSLSLIYIFRKLAQVFVGGGECNIPKCQTCHLHFTAWVIYLFFIPQEMSFIADTVQEQKRK